MRRSLEPLGYTWNGIILVVIISETQSVFSQLSSSELISFTKNNHFIVVPVSAQLDYPLQ